jgi:cobyrinic acid a,c-diamide synthase
MSLAAGGAASCAAVLVAAPASGQGKTTVAAALARLHARAGRRVRVFKCGPDFLDPQWLALASGAPVHPLDLWINGEADCRARLHAAAIEADLLIVEGVMGLFDGRPSAADLAARFGLPVLAVIDARAMAGTFGALAFGLQNFRPGLPWLGVPANRVAGERHAGMLRDALREPAQWLGGLPHGPAFALPERHLGLVTTGDTADALARLDAAADALAATPLGERAIEALPRVRFEAPAAASATTASPLASIRPTSRPWRRSARGWSSSRHWPATRCRPATPSGCRAATRNSTPPRSRPASRCARRWPPMSPPASRCGPSAAG